MVWSRKPSGVQFTGEKAISELPSPQVAACHQITPMTETVMIKVQFQTRQHGMV